METAGQEEADISNS